MQDFDGDYPMDTALDQEELPLLGEVVRHLKRVQSNVGYGNFHLLGFDRMLRVGRNYSSVAPFRRAEQEFLERTFYENATRYGFFGEKVLTRLTDEVPAKSVVKIRGTGQYLVKGTPLNTYREVKRAVGEDLVLTSGVRGTVKQMYLFLNKALEADGNFSRASRSLAPPGYSYHAIGDFDVGQKGFGKLNFTASFAKTDVYQRLVELGFVKVRYPLNNLLGVRYEPWHVKVA